MLAQDILKKVMPPAMRYGHLLLLIRIRLNLYILQKKRKHKWYTLRDLIERNFIKENSRDKKENFLTYKINSR